MKKTLLGARLPSLSPRYRADRRRTIRLIRCTSLRVIHTIHQAMAHHRSYQSRYTGESRCPRQKWIPVFAGKARKGRQSCIN